MSYIDQRCQEVIDGKLWWNVNDDCGGNHDAFLTEIVEPLRALKRRGLFRGLDESYRDSKKRIWGIYIITPINVDCLDIADSA